MYTLNNCNVFGQGRSIAKNLLLAFDPGETTGIALFDLADKKAICAGTVTGLNPLWNMLHRVKPTGIASEAFRLYPHKAAAKIYSSFPEIEVIGVIRLYCQSQGIELYENMASQAKSKYPDSVLKRLNCLPTNKHARDAVRHACLYLGLRPNDAALLIA